MDRESFIFYRSFYEAIKCMPTDVQAEIYPAICEYALFGKLPKNLSEVAKGMFTLIKPNIDVNTARFENGKKGGRKSRAKKQTATAEPAYTLTYEHLPPCFLDRCNEDKTRKGKEHHDSFVDCQSHLRYWMSKAYAHQQTSTPAPEDDAVPFPDMGDSFGGVDYDEQ